MSQQQPTPQQPPREPRKPVQRPQRPSLDRLLIERYGDLARRRSTQ